MESKLNGLDLFSGIGGITLALSNWVTPVAYCEIDKYAQAVLLSRMATGDITTAPIWDDVKTLSGEFLPKIDIIYGGFPCQDISVAGLGKGLAGERSGLFFEILRLAKELKPTFIFLENVPAISTRGCNVVAQSLAEIGYDVRWDTISAREVGAEFEGFRWFALAKARSERLEGVHQKVGGVDLQQIKGPFSKTRRSPQIVGTDAEILRRGHGIPFALDRVKCLGNSVVPAQVEEAFCRLMGLA